jgi:hypothetical protein
MRSCVASEDSFHGLCKEMEWTETWANGAVKERPRSIVVTLDDAIVAYFDLPHATPKTVGEEAIDHYRRAFWCSAAGVRKDILGAEKASDVFQQLLYCAFEDAMTLGYDHVRAAAPWDKHPYLPLPFAKYPGLSVEPFVDDEGNQKYLLEWRLADAVKALVSNVVDPAPSDV